MPENRPKLCRWCGVKITNTHAFLCANCENPIRLIGYVAVTTSFVAKNLLLPLIIGIATYYLSTKQQETASDVSDRRKLAEAYVDFGSTQTDIRRAVAAIDVMQNEKVGGNIPSAYLKSTVLSYDAAFNALGIKLAPFEEVARRNQYYANSSHAYSSALVETWHRCYVVPYYGSKALSDDKTYWYKIKDEMKKCTADTCPRDVAANIGRINWDIFSGTCLCGVPEPQRPLTWFYEELQSIMVQHSIHTEISVPGDRNLAPINNDLIKAHNSYCK